jgi:hypothetical protein
MFNKHVLEVLKHNNRVDPFNSYGEHMPMKTMVGGIRYRPHPVPEMDFQPDNLFTGTEMYEDIKPRMLERRRYVGGAGSRVHADFNGMDERGGSLKSFGRDFMKGLKRVGKVVAPVVRDIGREVLPIVKDEGIKALKEGLPLMLAAGRKKKGYAKPTTHDRREARGLLVRKIMSQHGLSLVEASRYIKANNLQY